MNNLLLACVVVLVVMFILKVKDAFNKRDRNLITKKPIERKYTENYNVMFTWYKDFHFRNDYIPTDEDKKNLECLNFISQNPPSVFADEEELDEVYSQRIKLHEELKGKICFREYENE